MTGTAALRAVAVSRVFGRGDAVVRAVDKADIEVAQGESLVVTGPSGCGKSTLLQMLGGLERPSEGEIWVGDRRIDTLSERGRAHVRRDLIGFVFQEFHLMEELTALENVELPALLAGASRRHALRRAVELLERVGLSDRSRHLPSALSGGQRQRVAVARALVNRPAVLLADEPTGNLDTTSATDVLRLFEELRADGQTLVVVTHDLRTAATADRMVSMRDGSFVDDVRLDAAGRSVAEILASPER
jgi:putative ABC transport system ATP-binding protein